MMPEPFQALSIKTLAMLNEFLQISAFAQLIQQCLKEIQSS